MVALSNFPNPSELPGLLRCLTRRERAELDRLLTIQASDTYRAFRARYRDDAAGFVRDCIAWREGEAPAPYQREILEQLPKRRRVAVRGPHGLGKTTLASWVILWFALTRDGGDDDWKALTTAGAWRQVTHYLWPEVHKWARRLKWDVIGRPAFTAFELLTLNLKLSTGEAFSAVSDNPDLIEGAHAGSILILFDESKAIPDKTFDAAEGALAIGDCYALSISTPGEPSGRFYDIHSRKPGFDDWWARHVTKAEALACGRMSETWAEQRRKQWTEQSAVYQNRVEGEFASNDEDGVIPLGWLELANERWRVWADAGKVAGKFESVGADIARSGIDKTVLAPLFNVGGLRIVTELRRTSREDTMATTGRIDGILTKHGGMAVVDVIGIGAGVVDRLREKKRAVTAFNASESSDIKDKSGELGFVNKRSAGWWALREMLDPDGTARIALPPDDLLTGDLTAPKWRVMSGGKIQIESKDEIKKRIGRSTDDGDAVVMAFYREKVSQVWVRGPAS